MSDNSCIRNELASFNGYIEKNVSKERILPLKTEGILLNKHIKEGDILLLNRKGALNKNGRFWKKRNNSW